MLSILPVCLALVCAASGQPLVCREDVECPEKYYCETDAHVCRKCLSCHDLKRDLPAGSTPSCIKSVAECGACYKGLVPDRHRGDVNAECVLPDPAMSDGMTSYLWLFIIVGLMFFGLVVGIIVYVVRNPEIFKTPAPSQPNVTALITASAPEAPPPPYNSVPYKDVRPDSPPYHYTGGGHGHTEFAEDSRFIVHPPPPRAEGRVPEVSQTAKVYNKPAYLREPRSPSPDMMSEPDEATGFTIHDEETTMSTWTPNGVANNDEVNGNAAANNDTALMPAGGLQGPTPAKKRCVGQDSNNNRNRESSDDSDRSPSPGQSAPSINLTQIFNVQINK